MAWIESHQALEKHPKVLRLSRACSWSIPETIGRLQMFWWWCLDYATDGRLDKHGDAVIANVFGVTQDHEKFVALLIEIEFLDSEPEIRVHDWWDYAGRFLQTRYKNKPKTWKEIKRFYGHSVQRTNNRLRTDLEPNQNHKPNQPNLTNPNLTKPNLTVVVRTRERKLGELEALSLSEELQSWAQREFGVTIPEDVLDEFKAYWREQTKLRTDWIATLKSRIRQLVSQGRLKPRNRDAFEQFLNQHEESRA